MPQYFLRRELFDQLAWGVPVGDSLHFEYNLAEVRGSQAYLSRINLETQGVSFWRVGEVTDNVFVELTQVDRVVHVAYEWKELL